MPGFVQNAVPITVLPQSLSRAFAHAREYIVLENEYRNGESQRSRLVNTSRKRWRLAKRLTPALLQQLRDFYDARKGPEEPFYFYDPWDTAPKFSHDPAGTATTGRYTVRFEGPWEQMVGMGRADAEIALVELA
ncbi:MAG TPA: hypothetical protein VNN17_02160 [Terriglobia bacterium]|nr:hypothetical protein [Terriglobia bacterium]